MRSPRRYCKFGCRVALSLRELICQTSNRCAYVASWWSRGGRALRAASHREMSNLNILLRDEAPRDFLAISKLTAAAFQSLEISRHTEQFIIEALRSAGALTVSLVAEVEGRVVGHIAFSPVTISDHTAGWYGLGPVSVLPEWQRRGIGTALIQAGLARLKALGGKGCCLVGHPQYYQRFGFRNVATLGCEGIPSEVFFALPLDGPFPQGVVAFHPAFAATGPVQ